MRGRATLFLIAATIFVAPFVQPSPVTIQQSKPPGVQKPSGENQASIEAREKLRQLAAKKTTYQVGYSPAMERKLTQLSGIEIPKGTVKQALEVREKAKAALAESIRRREQYYKENPDLIFVSADVYESIRHDVEKANPGKRISNNSQQVIPLLPAFNWRAQLIFRGSVKNQGDCNSCWAFASLAAYEYSFHIQTTRVMGSRGKRIRDPRTGAITGMEMVGTGAYQLVLSEQKLIDCVGKDNSCGGGWHGSAFNHLVEYGAPFPWDSPDDPSRLEYTGKDGICKGLKVNKGFQALTWDYVNYPPDKIPTVPQLKTALLEHGPIVALVRITDAFQAYRGGVFNERAPGEVNHAVTLIGWDDSKRAWLIQNSWGEEWGEKIKFGSSGAKEGGFMWIAWNSNSIGKYAAWVDAKMEYR